MIYEVDDVLKIVKTNTEFTFLNVAYTNDAVIKVEAETYQADENNLQGKQPIDQLIIVFKDTKKRQAKTLEKLGVTKEELENGVPDDEGSLMLSEYFIKHDGIIVSYQTDAKVRRLNKRIQANMFKSISNYTFDIKAMVKLCKIDCPDLGTITNTKRALKCCLKKYDRMKHVEMNKQGCIVNYAYYMELGECNKLKRIFCKTSIGAIYYDPVKDRWDMSKKERDKTGLMIESFDLNDVKSQLRNKYNVCNMSELEIKLRQISKERTKLRAIENASYAHRMVV